VEVLKSVRFTAEVVGVSNTSVTWAVNDILGGDGTVGRIDSTGLYVAPQSIPSPATVTVKATSQADTTRSASGTTTVIPDSTPPRILSFSPSANAVEVSVVSPVQIDFSEALDPATVGPQNFRLSLNTSEVFVTISYDPAAFRVLLFPSSSLARACPAFS
jgi:hypothetical protein